MKRSIVSFIVVLALALCVASKPTLAGQWTTVGTITYLDVWGDAVHFQLDGGTKGNFYNCASPWAYRLLVTTTNKHQIAALYLAFSTGKGVKVYEVACDSTTAMPLVGGLNVAP